MSVVFTIQEVAKHNTKSDCWIIVKNKVYDVTNFLDDHPGGAKVLLAKAGKDATEEFEALHSASVMSRYGPSLLIGVVGSKAKEQSSATSSNLLGTSFGAKEPFAEPYWYNKHFKSPYYTESHCKFRALVRNFIEKEVVPNISDWEEKMDYPRELHEKAYAYGVYGAPWPEEYGGTPPEGGFDAFHDFIFWDELARYGGGWLAACFLTIGIALPPVLFAGSDYIKNKVAKGAITGKKIMALAVTEPYAGSDVANIRTTARREGDFFIVNGEKKFITSGLKADYFTTAVRTGGPGMGGISLLLIEKDMPGIGLRKIKTQGWYSSNTAYITFTDVKVPVKNIIGQENKGFYAIMHNFNHERFAGIVMGVRGARMCIEQSVKYARNRKTFGKRLIDHQVIRHKIAEMARKVESLHAWTELIAYQMTQNVPALAIAGRIALLKVHTTTALEFCAREASQILGGNACVRGGVGEIVERIYRDVRIAAIGGGSEEVMRDLAMRQARL